MIIFLLKSTYLVEKKIWGLEKFSKIVLPWLCRFDESKVESSITKIFKHFLNFYHFAKRINTQNYNRHNFTKHKSQFKDVIFLDFVDFVLKFQNWEFVKTRSLARNQCYQLGRFIGKRPFFKPLEPIEILEKSAADFLPIEILGKTAEFQPIFGKYGQFLADFQPFLAVKTENGNISKGVGNTEQDENK